MESKMGYFIERTDARFENLSKEIKELRSDIQDLREFKIEMLVQSRMTSLIVSSVVGFITMLVTTAVTVWITKA